MTQKTQKSMCIILHHPTTGLQKEFFLDREASKKGFVTIPIDGELANCDGCGLKIYATGFFPDGYQNDVVECLGCGAKYFVDGA
jgi:hypothetical protein